MIKKEALLKLAFQNKKFRAPLVDLLFKLEQRKKTASDQPEGTLAKAIHNTLVLFLWKAKNFLKHYTGEPWSWRFLEQGGKPGIIYIWRSQSGKYKPLFVKFTPSGNMLKVESGTADGYKIHWKQTARLDTLPRIEFFEWVPIRGLELNQGNKMLSKEQRIKIARHILQQSPEKQREIMASLMSFPIWAKKLKVDNPHTGQKGVLLTSYISYLNKHKIPAAEDPTVKKFNDQYHKELVKRGEKPQSKEEKEKDEKLLKKMKKMPAGDPKKFKKMMKEVSQMADSKPQKGGKKAGLLSELFTKKKPPTFEGTDEEYVQNALKKKLPKAQVIGSKQIREAKNRLKKARLDFFKSMAKYSKEEDQHLRDALLLQIDMEEMAKQPKAMSEEAGKAWERIQEPNYSADEFKEALEKFKKTVSETQALMREWGEIL